MPESVRDRCTKAHEYIFLFSKSERYYFDMEAIKEPARYPEGPRNKKPHEKFEKSDVNKQYFATRENVHKIGPKATRQKRSVWTVTTKPFKMAHFATFPPDLIEPCILAGCPKGGIVLDPFFGAGTVGLVAMRNERGFIGIELNPEYVEIARKRLQLQEKVT
jgi:DNA modification methylase